MIKYIILVMSLLTSLNSFSCGGSKDTPSSPTTSTEEVESTDQDG